MVTQAYLQQDQTRQLEEVATCFRDRVLIRIYRKTGARVTEICGIHVEDFDFDQKMARILHEKQQRKLICPNCKKKLGRGFKVCPYCLEKADTPIEKLLENVKMRAIPIDDGTLNMVRELAKAMKLPWDGKGHRLFPFGRQRAWQIITEAATRAGLPKIINNETGKIHNVSPHKLRDAFAVSAMKIDDSGDGQRMLQEQLGHASFNTTAKYRKVASGELRTWYDKMTKEAS